jgi:hypothetical protein
MAYVNPFTVRTCRKLDEASFFLDRMRDSTGQYPEFGFYLSAFLSALRSVGFVLQSDLRGRFGEAFDRWWEAAKGSLPTPRVPFSVITELRNQALKKGELLPGMRVVLRIDHPIVEQVEYTLNLSDGAVVIAQERYEFRQRAGPSVQMPNPEDERERSAALLQAIPALQEVFRSLNEDEPTFEVASLQYQFEHGSDAVSFEELIAGFLDHVTAMRAIVHEADLTFGAER